MEKIIKCLTALGVWGNILISIIYPLGLYLILGISTAIITLTEDTIWGIIIGILLFVVAGGLFTIKTLYIMQRLRVAREIRSLEKQGADLEQIIEMIQQGPWSAKVKSKAISEITA